MQSLQFSMVHLNIQKICKPLAELTKAFTGLYSHGSQRKHPSIVQLVYIRSEKCVYFDPNVLHEGFAISCIQLSSWQ
jgi:hypothetical protein